jgi:predicted ribosomally synthesized peptide with SipW-like signal peptide
VAGFRPPRGLRASIRVRAALAGGLVFGLAAGVTVASWTDAESATASFGTTRFGVEQSVAGGAYTTSTSVALTVTGVYPGSTGRVFVPILLRTTPGSLAGTITIAHAAVASPAGLTSVLRYRMARSASCDASVFSGSPVYLAGDAATTLPVSSALTATSAGALAAAGGSTLGLCLEFSLPTGLTQATYQGTSTVPLAFTVSGSS